MAAVKQKNSTFKSAKVKPDTPGVSGPQLSNAQSLVKHRFHPGQSGNPKGRPPRGCSIAEMLRKLGLDHVKLYDPIVMEQLIRPRVEHMLRGVYFEALYNHEAWAVNFIAERTEGKVKETVHQIIEDLTIDVEGEDYTDGNPYSTDELDVYDDDGKRI